MRRPSTFVLSLILLLFAFGKESNGQALTYLDTQVVYLTLDAKIEAATALSDKQRFLLDPQSYTTRVVFAQNDHSALHQESGDIVGNGFWALFGGEKRSGVISRERDGFVYDRQGNDFFGRERDSFTFLFGKDVGSGFMRGHETKGFSLLDGLSIDG